MHVMKPGLMALASAVMLGVSGTASASLQSANIVNGGFEDGAPAGIYTSVVPGWFAQNVGGFTGIWGSASFGDHPQFPVVTGAGAGALGFSGGGTVADGSIAALVQSLGTVDANDIGWEFQVSAEFGARGFAPVTIAEVDIHWDWSANASVAFVDAQANVLGTPGTTLIEMSTGTPVLAHELEMLMASFVPDAGHVGMEVFVVVAAEKVFQTSLVTADQMQYVVDNVMFTAIPEPASLVLMGAGAVLLVRRSRRTV